MAEGNVYEDESELQPQQNQVSKSAGTPSQQLKLSKPYNWSEAELNRFVLDGTLRKDDTSLEHIALHPYWLSNPLNGVKEELEGNLGKWRPSMNGYLVAVKNIRLVKRKPSLYPKVGFMYQDQPWIHVDAGATFYLYTPTVGQKLTGTIAKFGAKAVICVLFKCFSASVFPQSDGELNQWNLGEELPFEITSVQNRRKGPLIRATSIGVTSKPRTIPSVSTAPEEEHWTITDSVGPDNAEETADFHSTASPSPNKRCKRSYLEYGRTSPVIKRHSLISPVPEFAQPSEEAVTKKKKTKHRENSESQEHEEMTTPKKHKKYSSDIVISDTFENSDDSTVKKKKHRHRDWENNESSEHARPKSKKDKKQSADPDIIATDVFENSDAPTVKKKKKHR